MNAFNEQDHWRRKQLFQMFLCAQFSFLILMGQRNYVNATDKDYSFDPSQGGDFSETKPSQQLNDPLQIENPLEILLIRYRYSLSFPKYFANNNLILCSLKSIHQLLLIIGSGVQVRTLNEARVNLFLVFHWFFLHNAFSFIHFEWNKSNLIFDKTH